MISPEFFVVLSGEVVIVQPAVGQDVRLALLGEGQFTGEAALVSGRANVVRVRALTDGEVVAYEARNGRVRWRFHLGPCESSPLVVGGLVYVGDWHGHVYALDVRTGKRRWVFHTDGAVKGCPSLQTPPNTVAQRRDDPPHPPASDATSQTRMSTGDERGTAREEHTRAERPGKSPGSRGHGRRRRGESCSGRGAHGSPRERARLLRWPAPVLPDAGRDQRPIASSRETADARTASVLRSTRRRQRRFARR